MKDESVSGQNTGVVCLHWLSATVTAFVLYLCMCVCVCACVCVYGVFYKRYDVVSSVSELLLKKFILK